MRTGNLTKDKVIKQLKVHTEDLKRYGVTRVGLFGSFARSTEKPKSDIDLVVEFDRSVFGKDMKGLFDAYTGLSYFLEHLFGRKVDILTPESIETIRVKGVAEEIKRSLIYV
jgi:predicted nucleotidyltransferase